MTRRLGLRTGAMVGLVLAVSIVMPASPALADSVTITEPAGNAVLSGGTVVVRGRAEVPPPALGIPLSTLESVTVTIGDKTLTAPNCSGKASCDYEVTFTLPLNGPYKADVVAKPNGLLAGDASKASRSFAVAAPAARPVLAAPKVTGARNVELSWSRNTEPDMLYYAVFRKDPGGSKFFQVGGKVTHPKSGSRVTFVDTTTSGVPGGEYSYQVVAVRNGASGSADTEKLSEPSAAGAATLPVSPITSSTTVPLPGTPPAGPTTTVKPGPPAGIDLSGFLSSRSQPVTLPAITVPVPPDTGFAGSLPFGARPPGEELEEGEADAVPPRGSPGSSVIRVDAGRPLVPVAGGLVLLLLAMHMRLLGRRVKEPAGSDAALDLAPHTPAAAVASMPPAAAPAEPAPHRILYDIEAEDMEATDDREEDWAPQAPGPAPAPVAPRRPVPVPRGVRKREARPVPVVSPKPAPERHPEPISEMEAEAVPVAAVEREHAAAPKALLGPDPEPVAVVEPTPVAEVDRQPEPVPVEQEVVELWAPIEPENRPDSEPEPEPAPPVVVPEEIEIVEIVSSTRRRLVRTGGR